MTDGKNKGGRKSKTEELQLGPQKEAFLAELAALNLRTEAGLAEAAMRAAFAQVRGLLSVTECDSLQKACAISLRALKQEKADSEVARLEEMVLELRKRVEKADQDAQQRRARAH